MLITKSAMEYLINNFEKEEVEFIMRGGDNHMKGLVIEDIAGEKVPLNSEEKNAKIEVAIKAMGDELMIGRTDIEVELQLAIDESLVKEMSDSIFKLAVLMDVKAIYWVNGKRYLIHSSIFLPPHFPGWLIEARFYYAPLQSLHNYTKIYSMKEGFLFSQDMKDIWVQKDLCVPSSEMDETGVGVFLETEGWADIKHINPFFPKNLRLKRNVEYFFCSKQIMPAYNRLLEEALHSKYLTGQPKAKLEKICQNRISLKSIEESLALNLKNKKGEMNYEEGLYGNSGYGITNIIRGAFGK